MTYQTILLDIAGGVATITLNRPNKKNAFDMEMRRELAQSLEQVRGDESVRALIVTGAGGDFCAGADIGNMAGEVSSEAGRKRMQSMYAWLGKLIELDRPVIAAVDGVAYGAGFSLALAADLVIASPRARFCLSFMRIGLVPDCGVLYTLPRVVGMQRARELMYSAREFDAAAAKEYGIVVEVVPAESLLERARAMACSFVNASAVALALTKAGLNRSFETDFAALLEYESAAQAVAITTDPHRAAVRRFLAKQPTLYKWPAG